MNLFWIGYFCDLARPSARLRNRFMLELRKIFVDLVHGCLSLPDQLLCRGRVAPGDCTEFRSDRCFCQRPVGAGGWDFRSSTDQWKTCSNGFKAPNQTGWGTCCSLSILIGQLALTLAIREPLERWSTAPYIVKSMLPPFSLRLKICRSNLYLSAVLLIALLQRPD